MSGTPPEVITQPTEPLSPARGIRRARTLLIVFSFLLALWVASMIAMYVLTVYPQRYPSTQPTPISRK